jgi:hypothetical protein
LISNLIRGIPPSGFSFSCIINQVDVDAPSPEAWLSIEKLNHVAGSHMFHSLGDVLGIIALQNNHFFSLFFDDILKCWFTSDPMKERKSVTGLSLPVVPVDTADEFRHILMGLTSALIIKPSTLSSADLRDEFYKINKQGVLTLASIVSCTSTHCTSSTATSSAPTSSLQSSSISRASEASNQSSTRTAQPSSSSDDMKASTTINSATSESASGHIVGTVYV